MIAEKQQLANSTGRLCSGISLAQCSPRGLLDRIPYHGCTILMELEEELTWVTLNGGGKGAGVLSTFLRAVRHGNIFWLFVLQYPMVRASSLVTTSPRPRRTTFAGLFSSAICPRPAVTSSESVGELPFILTSDGISFLEDMATTSKELVPRRDHNLQACIYLRPARKLSVAQGGPGVPCVRLVPPAC